MITMKSQPAFLASIFLIMSSSFVYAEDTCQAVYLNATRDIDVQTKINQQLDYVYDRYCNKDGSKQTFNMSDAVGVIFDDLPFNFKSSKGATNERSSEFCKAYSSQRYVNDRYFHYRNEVQVAALNAFNQCIALRKQGIEISYSPNGVVGGTINGKFQDRQTTLVVNSVLYDKELVNCTLSSSDFKSAQKIDDKKPIPVNHNFTVTCRRTPKKESGKVYYPETDVRMDTSSGGYSVHFEGDALNGFYLANEARAKYDEGQRNLEQSKKSEASLLQRLKSVRATVHLFATGQDAEIPCESANAAAIEAYTRKVCGNGIPSLNDRGISGGRKCGYHYFALACIDTGT